MMKLKVSNATNLQLVAPAIPPTLARLEKAVKYFIEHFSGSVPDRFYTQLLEAHAAHERAVWKAKQRRGK